MGLGISWPLGFDGTRRAHIAPVFLTGKKRDMKETWPKVSEVSEKQSRDVGERKIKVAGRAGQKNVGRASQNMRKDFLLIQSARYCIGTRYFLHALVCCLLVITCGKDSRTYKDHSSHNNNHIIAMCASSPKITN